MVNDQNLHLQPDQTSLKTARLEGWFIVMSFLFCSRNGLSNILKSLQFSYIGVYLARLVNQRPMSFPETIINKYFLQKKERKK